MKNIESIRYPNGAQSNPFFGALASALLPALGYTEDTPFFCAQKNSYCIQCGNCNNTNLSKHQDQLYHDYITYTGVALGWYWPEDADKRFQTLPCAAEGWFWPDDFIAYIMGIAGLTWKRLNAEADRDEIYSALTASIDAGHPSLMKLGGGPDWHTVTGYDGEGKLYALGHPNATVAPERVTDEGLAVLPDWYEHFVTAVVITGRCEPGIGPKEILARMIGVLAHSAHAAMEEEIMRRIDALTLENADEVRRWLTSRVDIPIEDRYHIASCVDKTLPNMIGNEEIRKLLFEVLRMYVFDDEVDSTHGACWKIWRLLGVSRWVDARPASDVPTAETKKELKRLFSVVFANDRFALECLRKSLALLEA